VHIFDAHGAAIRIAKPAEDVSHLPALLTRESAGRVRAIKVPQREAVRLDVEVRVPTRARAERVDICHEVPARTVGVDQFGDASGLGLLRTLIRGGVFHPAHGLVGHAQRHKDAVVETIEAEKLLVDQAQELSRLRALDDPVVVRRRQGEHLGDSKPGDGLGRRALEFGGVVHRADAYDRALALHEARHGMDGADRARICQGECGALEIGGLERSCARMGHDRLVRRPKLREVHVVGALNIGH